MSFRRRALFLAGLFVAVSCSDAGNPVGPPVDPTPRPGPGDGVALDCSLHVATGTLACGTPGAGTGPASGDNIIVGKQNVKVKLVASGHTETGNPADGARDTLAINVTVQNLMAQALGTTDGTTLDPSGVQLFFHFGPIGQPTGEVDMVNALNGVFLEGNTPYYQYNEILSPGEVSPAQTWIFASDESVTNIHFRILVKAAVQFPGGFVKVTPKGDTLAVGETVDLDAIVYNAHSDTLPVSPTWSSNAPSVATVDASTGLVTAVGMGTAVITATEGAKTGTATIVVNNAPVVLEDTTAAVSNVTVPRPAGRLLAKATDAEALSVVADSINTAQNGVVIANADGSFTYLSAPGFSGEDSFQFQVTDGVRTTTGTMKVNVAASNYWYVRAGPPAVTADGRDRRPFGSIAAAQAVAGAADSIFVLASGQSLTEAVVLKNQQGLVGAGITSPIFFKMSALDSVAVMTPGAMPGLTHTAGTTVTVAQNNVIEGVSVDNAGGTAIGGSGFATLRVRQVSAEPSGRALDLATGTLDAVFLTLSAVGTTSGIVLNTVDGSLSVAGSGRISVTGAGGPAVSVTGGNVSLSYAGDVVQRSAHPLLAVSSHTGTMDFGGVLADSAGTGLQFSNAGGTYTFADSVTLAGGNAGLDLLASNGVFTFAHAAIVSPSSGPAVNVVGGSPALVYRGSITHATGRAVVVDGITADSVVLRAAITSGTPAAPAGLGILVQNVSGGIVALDSAKSFFTGANPAVTLAANTGGLVRFGGVMDITTTAGAGFTASGAGTVSVTGTNTVATGTGVPVSLTSVNTGTAGVSFSSISTSTGAANGIVLNGISGAGFQGTGGTISGTTGPAVQLTSTNAADSVSLRGMTLSRSGGTGAVISGTTFGKLHVLNTSVTATGGPGALALTTGTLSGAFTTLSSNASTASGVSLTGVDGTFNAGGGSINTAGAAAFAVSGGSVGGTISATVAQASAFPLLSVAGDHGGTITFAGNLTAINGTGLQFTAADGTYNLTGALALGGAGSAVGNDAGIDIGSGSSGTVNVTPAGANTASITSPVGIAITVAGGSADLNYNGNVTQASSAALLSVTGGHTGDLAFPVGTVNASNGTGLQFDNADGTYSFAGTVTLAGGDAGIDVTNGSGGTFTFPTTASITSPSTGNLISILNSAPSFTYSGAFTKTTNPGVTGILVSNNTGGSITFNGTGTKSITTGAVPAVNLASNGTASILFSGGGLSLTSGAGNGFTATGSGTVQVTGANNTVNSTAGGTAVNIQNVTIGASGVSLLSVSASGGGGGIVLQNTGSNGLQVTGGSTHGSGGTVVNASGADGAIAGNGVYLENASNVSLSWMSFSGHANHAIRGITASNVTLTRLRITGTNGSNAGFDEGAIVFTNLTGSASITSSYIEGGFEDNVRVANTTGTLNRLTMNGDTIGHNGSTGNDGVLLDASSTATMNVTVQNSRFTGSRSNNVHYVLNNDAGGDFVFNNNVLTNNHPNKLGSDFGINVGSTSNGAMTYTISGNSVRDAGGSGIEVSHLAGGSGPMTGSITNNVVGTAGAANSGSNAGSTIVAAVVGAGTSATHNTTITGNTLRQYTNYGIRLINRGTGNGYLNAVVKTNNIAEPSPNAAAFAAYSGIRAELGASSVGPDNGRTCLDISGNTLNQTGSSSQADLRVFGRFGTRTSLLGLGQGGASADPNTFLNSQNTITVAPGGFGAVNATSTNAFQSTCPPV
jgi:hypothetical protein